MSKKEITLLGVLAALVAALLIVLLVRGRETAVAEFTPPPFDPTAAAGTPAVPEEDAPLYGTLNLAEGITVSLCSSVNVEGNEAAVWFTAHEGNTAWVRLRILDTEGNTLGETGLLRPGEYVESILLQKQPKQAWAVAKILTYEPDTYYSLGSASAQIMLRTDGK